MSDYLPINSNSLRIDTKIGCDLYLLVKTGAGSRYILYCRGDTLFETDKRELLLEKNIKRNIMSTWNLIFKISYLIQGFLPMSGRKSYIVPLHTW